MHWYNSQTTPERTPRQHHIIVHSYTVAQSIGRKQKALAMLGEALEKWNSMPDDGKEGGLGNNKHEVFFDRGVLR